MKHISSKLPRFQCGILIHAALTMTAFVALNDGNKAISAPAPVTSPADAWTYADVADLFLESPVVLTARIVEAIPLRNSAGSTTAAVTNRYYIVADAVALIRGSSSVASRVAWLTDVTLDGRGKAPRLKKTQVIVSAFAVTSRPGELKLAARDAMVPWSPALESRVRGVIASGLAADAPPRVTGIASAFHSAGNLPGEGETQLFLGTPRSQPVSINVLRRPGFDPQWAVALGEIVDEAARPPERDTLGWYRLACFLPVDLPEPAVGELSANDIAAVRTDYRFVLQSLGPCARTRSRR